MSEESASLPRALIADDDTVSRMVACALVREAGFMAKEARDVQEAVAIAATTKFDLILLDLHMPGMEKREALVKVQAAAPPGAKIVLLTGETGDEKLFPQADAWIVKPLTQEKLNALTEHLFPNRLRPALVDRGLMEVFRRRSAESHVPVLQTVVRIFLENAPREIELIREATRQSDLRRVADLAHALEGSSRYVGAVALASLCKQIERCAREGKPAADPITDLYTVFLKTAEALKQEAAGP